MACSYRSRRARVIVYIQRLGGTNRFARGALQRGVVLLFDVVSFFPRLEQAKKMEKGRHAAEK